MPVPENHPNLWCAVGASTGCGVGKKPSRPVNPTNCIPTDASRSDVTRSDEKKRLPKFWRCRKPSDHFWRVMGPAEQCLDARRKQWVHADYFMEDNVAIATVWVGDDRQCCTWTLCGVVGRSVLRQLESRHVDVSCWCAPARAQDVRVSNGNYGILGRARIAKGQRVPVRQGTPARPEAAEKEAHPRSTRQKSLGKRSLIPEYYTIACSMQNTSAMACAIKEKNVLKVLRASGRRQEKNPKYLLLEKCLRCDLYPT